MDITFKNVSYTYQANTPFAHKALDDVSFHIPSHTFVAIIGHTGSGKSTLIQHLNGLVMPTEGEVVIGDYNLSNRKKPKNLKELRRKVGVVFQYPEHQLFEETVEKDVAFGPLNFGVSEALIKNRILEIFPQIGLSTSLLSRSPFDLSGGQMRRVAIAGVLATEPDIYVLDEPTAGLDPRGQKEIMDMFYRLHKERNVTTVLVTHSMEDAIKYADHIIILNEGKKYMEGKAEQLFMEVEKLRDVQLNIPEQHIFLNKYMEKFKQTVAIKDYDVKDLAQLIYSQLKAGKENE